MKQMMRLATLVVIVSLPGLATAALGCGDLQNAYGPFDYRKVPKDSKHLVESAHFTPSVEMLIKGNTGALGGDIDYTLRALPNSPRALLAMSRLGLKEKTETPYGANYSVECYFDRAFRLAPDDPMPRLIYGMHLKDRKRREEALKQLDMAADLKKENTNYEFPYNMALTYFELGQYEKSLQFAKQAYELGAPLPGLRNKLVAAGKWVETPTP